MQTNTTTAGTAPALLIDTARSALETLRDHLGDLAASHPSVTALRIAIGVANGSIPRFHKVSADGVIVPADSPQWVAVYDALQERTFARSPLKGGEDMDWADAEREAAALDLCGWVGQWRQPTRSELLGIIDDTRTSPALATNLLDGPFDWTWTSTPYAGRPSGAAWFVSLGGGNSSWSYRDDEFLARAVRAGQVFGHLELAGV